MGIEGRVLNSEHVGHVVRVESDESRAGGFLIFQRWAGSDGPNGSGEFDDWVENEELLRGYFSETGWKVQWEVK